MIVIGIDPHKSSITASAIDSSDCQLTVRRFVVNAGLPSNCWAGPRNGLTADSLSEAPTAWAAEFPRSPLPISPRHLP